MRTVDPVQWSRKIKKPPINVSRPWRYRVDVVSALELRLRNSFCDAMLDFVRHCPIGAARSVIDKSNSKTVRWCYAALLLLALWCCGAVTAYSAWRQAGVPPLAVARLAAQAPAQRVDFPAVALCSYNTVSAHQRDNYANYLYNLQKNSTYTMAELKQNLQAFSGLITSSLTPVSYDTNFTKFLADVARETNVTNIIYKLSPKCESMLVRCGWRGRRLPCDRLFALRITDIGYCCVFNSRYSLEDRQNDPKRVTRIGQDFGLSVVVKENADDFTYVRRAGEELEMLLFDGHQYPLVRAGVVRSYPLRRNASVFVALKASVQQASDSLRYFTEAYRGCVMMSPSGSVNQPYWAQCVAECRRRAVLALCMCSPHTKPAAIGADDVTCSLEHLACLAKHREKLTYFYPGENAHESLSEEQSDSVECLHCLPNCARMRYFATIAMVPYLNHVNKFFHNRFLSDLKLWNASVIRIYFPTEYQPIYLVESYVRFYEVFSYISSQWVLLAGVTLMSLVDFIYHCTIRWHHHYKRRCRNNGLPKLKYVRKT